MAALSIHSLATWLPETRQHRTLLGTAVPGAYHHLFDPAGNDSRPPTVRRGVTALHTDPYEAPSAPEALRVGDMASMAVARLLAGQEYLRAQVDTVLNTQCTLDQQILGSTCLRICHEHMTAARTARTIGQVGTAGVPIVFRLTQTELHDRGPDSLVCVTACDKWIAPFFRHVPGVLTHADAAASCLLRSVDDEADHVAVIDAISTSVQSFAGDVWRASADDQRQHVLAHAVSVVTRVLGARRQDAPADLVLVGDAYSGDLGDRLSASVGIPQLAPSACTSHLSSASPLFAIAWALEEAARRGRALEAVVWTVSIAGHAGALLVRCRPDALCREGAWQPGRRQLLKPRLARMNSRKK